MDRRLLTTDHGKPNKEGKAEKLEAESRSGGGIWLPKPTSRRAGANAAAALATCDFWQDWSHSSRSSAISNITELNSPTRVWRPAPAR
jgi:hypothetical protein